MNMIKRIYRSTYVPRKIKRHGLVSFHAVTQNNISNLVPANIGTKFFYLIPPFRLAHNKQEKVNKQNSERQHRKKLSALLHILLLVLLFRFRSETFRLVMEKMVDQHPVGFRFLPTDEEIVEYYLRSKNMDGNKRHVNEFINTVDICSFDPWELRLPCKSY